LLPGAEVVVIALLLHYGWMELVVVQYWVVRHPTLLDHPPAEHLVEPSLLQILPALSHENWIRWMPEPLGRALLRSAVEPADMVGRPKQTVRVANDTLSVRRPGFGIKAADGSPDSSLAAAFTVEPALEALVLDAVEVPAHIFASRIT
jgi:hypothetical protein